MESVVCHGRSASCICCRTWQMRMSRLSWRAWRTSLHKIKAMFSICTCTCMYMYHIKTGDMKCLHSFICLCVIRLDRYYERFKQMTDLSPGVGYGRAPLMMWISNKTYAPRSYGKMETWLNCSWIVDSQLAVGWTRLINDRFSSKEKWKIAWRETIFLNKKG